jgi:hypothetical protein
MRGECFMKALAILKGEFFTVLIKSADAILECYYTESAHAFAITV